MRLRIEKWTNAYDGGRSRQFRGERLCDFDFAQEEHILAGAGH